MKTLELNQMEILHGGATSKGFYDGIKYGCLAVGVAASIATGFVTFGTSLFWGTSLTAAFCAGASVGAAIAER